MSRMEEREIMKDKAGEKQKICREKHVQTKLNLILRNRDEKVKDEQEREMRLEYENALEMIDLEKLSERRINLCLEKTKNMF